MFAFDYVAAKDIHRQQTFAKLLFQTVPAVVTAALFVAFDVVPDPSFPCVPHTHCALNVETATCGFDEWSCWGLS